MEPVALPPPDSHYLNAAIGWLELGNPREAMIELGSISPAHRVHASVLDVLWRAHAAGKEWTHALNVARMLLRVAPGQANSWIHQAFTLHELGRTKAAWEFLLPAAERFPEEGVIPYNLACYACQMGREEDARTWLARAVKLRGKDTIRAMALADSDLEAMWPEITAW